MYNAQFIFKAGTYDEKFHRLNAIIDEVARELPGFVGAESWVSSDGSTRNASYYWHNLEDLKTFSRHPRHLEAKRQYKRWYDGFQVVISQVLQSYGDGGLAHLTPNERQHG
jgi:heme-degrading monooxygenase HmoA